MWNKTPLLQAWQNFKGILIWHPLILIAQWSIFHRFVMILTETILKVETITGCRLHNKLWHHLLQFNHHSLTINCWARQRLLMIMRDYLLMMTETALAHLYNTCTMGSCNEPVVQRPIVQPPFVQRAHVQSDICTRDSCTTDTCETGQLYN